MLKSCRHILFTGLFGFLFLVLFKTELLYQKGALTEKMFQYPDGSGTCY